MRAGLQSFPEEFSKTVTHLFKQQREILHVSDRTREQHHGYYWGPVFNCWLPLSPHLFQIESKRFLCILMSVSATARGFEQQPAFNTTSCYVILWQWLCGQRVCACMHTCMDVCMCISYCEDINIYKWIITSMQEQRIGCIWYCVFFILSCSHSHNFLYLSPSCYGNSTQPFGRSGLEER